VQGGEKMSLSENALVRYVNACILIGSLTVLPVCGAQHPGGSKVLNESRAKVMIERAISSEAYFVEPQEILPLMQRSTNDYKSVDPTVLGQATPGRKLAELIKANIVSQTTRVDSFRNLSGTWNGHYPGQEKERWRLEISQAAGSNAFSGTCYNIDPYDRTDSTQVTGVVSPDDSLDLRQSFPVYGYPRGCMDQKFEAKRMQYSEKGSAGLLQAEDEMLIGPVAPKASITTYMYYFGREVASSGNTINVGHYQVMGVSDLLLGFETRAECSFTWQVGLDKVGQIMLGRAPSGKGKASFAKKPDGTWVLVPPVRF